MVEASAHYHHFSYFENQMATSSMKPACSRPPSHCGLLPLLILAALFPYSTTTSSSPAKSYLNHCESIVPHSTRIGPTVGGTTDSISLENGCFSGGDELLAPADASSVPSSLPYFYFSSRNLHPTQTPGIFKLDGSLSLDQSYSVRRRRNRYKNVVAYGYGKTVNFEMTGFWSKPSGKICMVGSGYVSNINQGTTLNPTAVFKLNYPQTSNISTSLVTGSIESLGTTDSPAHFQPVSLLAYAQNNYSYTKILQARHSCSHVNDVVPKEVLGFEPFSLPISSLSLRAPSVASLRLLDGFSTSTCADDVQNVFRGWFELERGNASCSVLDCTKLGFEPRFMSWSLAGCSEDGKVHMYVTFSADTKFEDRNAMQPEKSLVAEGVWDQEKNRLCVLAFPIIIPHNSAVVDASIGGNATIGISLWLPRVLSIEMRSTIVGRIWSEKAAARAISFRKNTDTGINQLPGIRYEYTRTRDANTKSCVSSRGNLENGRYPDGSSIGDLRFEISLKNKEGDSTWGSAVPLSLGETFYGYSIGSLNPPVLDIETATLEGANDPVLWNVSYKLSYSSFNRSSRMYVDISAEGVYNAETGTICMVGCREDQINSNLPMDCEISISIQLAPMNTGVDTKHLNGTIRSTRKKHDPLYFKPLEMSSYNMYVTEAIRTIRRMDAEIVMVLVFKTLSCVSIVLQLFHVKKRPQALSSVSIGMLVVLTLGQVIPLVLNFEALLFENTNKQNALLWRRGGGGWLEANEVIVRLTTLLAFLLQFRLLQSAWSARSSSSDDEKKKSLWVAERKALSYCLPLYFAGALIAWFLHTRSRLSQTQSKLQAYDDRYSYAVWEDLTSYAGLLLDGFLLPQIVLNMIGNCTEKALSPLFYVGITVVRAFPHVYDAYRSRYYAPSIDSLSIFATPHEDFYSYAWDVVIPFGGVLFAVLIFFQQKFGGSCFLPKRFRSVGGGYELVSVATT